MLPLFNIVLSSLFPQTSQLSHDKSRWVSHWMFLRSMKKFRSIEKLIPRCRFPQKLRAKRGIKLQKVIKTLGGTREKELPPRCAALTRWMSITKAKNSWISFDNEKHEKCHRGSFQKISRKTSLFPRLTEVVNDFVISLSIVFTCLSAVIAIERDWWWFSFRLWGEVIWDREQEKLMAFFSRLLFSPKGKVWHRTIDGSGQIVTL